MTFIDAVVIKGQGKTFSCHIETNENADIFIPLDLSPYSVRLRVLGSATADAKVLVEHIITQNTDKDVDGIIDDPYNGNFLFTITKEDTNILGLGNHPISLTLLDAETEEEVFTLTEGGLKGEFNSIQVVQV